MPEIPVKFFSIFYTNQKYRFYENRAKTLFTSFGFDSVIGFIREDIVNTQFYSENKNLLDSPRGDGYWVWKPYIILETFKKLDFDDVVFYFDIGDGFKSNPLILLREKISTFNIYVSDFNGNRKKNKFYTKRDCFVLMGCDKPEYHNGIQLEAGTLAFKKNEFTIKFLNEWLFYCKNENIVSDKPNEYGENFKEFVDHRHDQSVLTNLCIKYNVSPNCFLDGMICYNKNIPLDSHL